MEKQYKKLSVDFPVEEYTYLKMACVKQGVSLKDFVTKAIIKSVEEYEKELTVENLDDKDYKEASKKVFKKYGKMFSRLSKK